MKLISRLWRGLTRGAGVQTGQPGVYPAPSAAAVNFDTAMSLSAVWACARLLSETVSALPLVIYEKKRNQWVKSEEGELYRLFNGKVNRYQTRVEFFETMMLNLTLHGNAYALKQRMGNRLVGLLPIMSQQVETELLADGTVVHKHNHENGVTVYADESVWHLKLFGNGVVGLSPLGYARNSMGIALAAENRVGRIYRNGGKPTGVLTIDQVLKKEQREQIRQEFKDLQEGNEDTLMVLEAGLKYDQISLSPQDIQLLESRRFQIEDIARFFGVPSVLINDTSGSTVWGSGIQQIVQGFYKLNLRPYLERIEASIVQNLVAQGQRDTLMPEFDFDALLRADQGARFEAWQKGINAAMVTPNEARQAEGMHPLPGGDQLLVNGNMIPIAQAGRFFGGQNGV